jgi:hypothetical protein
MAHLIRKVLSPIKDRHGRIRHRAP